MSTTTAPVLYRIAAFAGLGSGAIVLINATKRAGIIPVSAGTQLVAPLAQVLALALVTGLFFAFARRTGVFGLVAYLVNALALALLVGVEFVINLVFAGLPPETITELRAGPLGAALTIASVLFLLGSLAFALALALTREVPLGALALYALGAIPVSLRAFVPEWALDAGLVAVAAGIIWLSIALLTRARSLASTESAVAVTA